MTKETKAPNVNSKHALKSHQYLMVQCVCVSLTEPNFMHRLPEAGARLGEESVRLLDALRCS